METEETIKNTVLDKEPLRRWNQHAVEMYLKRGGKIKRRNLKNGLTDEAANLPSGFYRGVGDHIAEERGFKDCRLNLGNSPRFELRGRNDRSNNI